MTHKASATRATSQRKLTAKPRPKSSATRRNASRIANMEGSFRRSGDTRTPLDANRVVPARSSNRHGAVHATDATSCPAVRSASVGRVDVDHESAVFGENVCDFGDLVDLGIQCTRSANEHEEFTRRGHR